MTWRQRLAILAAYARAWFAVVTFRAAAPINAATARLEHAMREEGSPR